MSCLYLLCISPPYRHAGHYLGFTEDDSPERRISQHLSGRGSPLIRAAVAAGSEVDLVRTWPDRDRTEERRLKRMGSSTRHCPRCGPGYRAAQRASRNPERRQLIRGPDGRWASIPAVSDPKAI